MSEEYKKNTLSCRRIRYMNRVKRIWYLSPMRAATVQASLRIRAVSPEPPLLAHTSSESRGTFRQKTRSLALLNGWACAIKICNDGMLEDINSLDGAHICSLLQISSTVYHFHNHYMSPVKRICLQAIRHDKFSLPMPSHSEGLGTWLSV